MERLAVTPAKAGGQFKKKIFWIPAFAGMTIALFCALARAETPQDAFQQANAAYAKGEFQQAVTHYESARSQGLRHWALYYNLGNAYYKVNAQGKAIASYLRAFRMRSNQRDVVYNLNLAATQVGEPLVPKEALGTLFWHLFYGLSLNILTILSSILFILFCLAGILVFRGLWHPSAEIILGSLMVLFVAGGWFGMRAAVNERPEGVIVSGPAEVRGAPTLTANTNFVVPEGRRVLILKEQEPIKGWLEIGVPQEGLKGWVPDSSVEPI